MPAFEVEGVPCVMETPKMGAVPCRILKSRVATLIEHQADITAALDFLFQGF
jgi:toxin CcdB